MKTLFLIACVLCFSCSLHSINYYNTMEDVKIVILDKRYVPGFTSPDKFMLKVREENEYRWVMTSKGYFSSVNVGDTIKMVLWETKIN